MSNKDNKRMFKTVSEQPKTLSQGQATSQGIWVKTKNRAQGVRPAC